MILLIPCLIELRLPHYYLGGNKGSYYFANIPRVIKETTDFFLIAQELKDGNLELSSSVKRKAPCSNYATIVVFSNDLPPLKSLSMDRWKIYRIEYDSSGTSRLKLMSQKDCVDLKKMG